MADIQQQEGKTAVQMKQAPQPGPLTPPVTLLLGDCRKQLPRLAADSVDLVVTSPPYANQRVATYGGVRPEWFIDLFTDPGDTVLDPFMGSATTAFAALGRGRDVIGIEAHEPYHKELKERLGLLAAA